MDILQYEFAQNALISMLFIAILSGVVGSLIVVRRMVFTAGGVTHASFGGLGVAYYLGFNPTLGALVFAMLTAAGVNLLHDFGKVREDSAIAMLWSLGMAIGVIFMSVTPGYAPNLMGYMFGDVLAVSRADLFAAGATSLIALVLVFIFYRPVLYISFDSAFAKLVGWKSNAVNMAISVFMALAIALSIKSVGIILVLSVFTIPQAIASMYFKDLWKIMFASGILALAGCLLGLLISFHFDLPVGAVITAVLTLTMLVMKLIRV